MSADDSLPQSAENDAGVLAFGQEVEFTWTLHRRGDQEPMEKNGRTVYPFIKRWVTKGWPGQPEPKPRKGIVIGTRFLANGILGGGSWEEPVTFEATERFRAYLVAFDMRRKPVLVLPEHTRPIPPEEVRP